MSLLKTHPEFDETPGQFPNNTNIYCRSWCPQNPEVTKVVFALVDELVGAFETTAFHVGMDEVFIIASEHCPRCKGGDPAKLFAKAVNDFLEGKAPDDSVAAKAADLILEKAHAHSHNTYKAPIASTLIRQALMQLKA